MQPKVLQLTGMTSTKFGGMERYLLELSRICATRGYSTIIQYQAEPASAEYCDALRAAGVEIVIQDCCTTSRSSVLAIAGLLKDVRPAIIHGHFVRWSLMPFIQLLGTRFGARRCIAMVHSVQHFERRSAYLLAYQGCTHVLGVSDAVCDDLRRGGVSASKLHKHYMGLIGPPCFDARAGAALRQALGIPFDSIAFGNIAFDAPVKGVDVLLNAFKKLLTVRPDVHLIQVGVDAEHSALQRSCQGTPNIHWLGIRDNAAEYLSAVDIYVQPSRCEGLPLAIMEAMAMARPIIATAVGGNTEAVIEDVTGIVVPPNDAEALFISMRELASSSRGQQRRDLGQAGYARFLDVFDGRRSVQRLVEEYYL